MCNGYGHLDVLSVSSPVCGERRQSLADLVRFSIWRVRSEACQCAEVINLLERLNGIHCCARYTSELLIDTDPPS